MGTAMIAILLAATAMAGEPNVLIRGDAKVHTQPDAASPEFTPEPEYDRAKSPDLVVHAQLLGRQDGWAHVRGSVLRGACHRALATNLPPGVEFWVRADDLVDAVTRSVEVSGKNGTKLSVSPGLVAYSNVDTSYSVAVEGLTVKAFLPQDAVGPKFTHERASTDGFQPTHGADGVFGDDKIEIRATKAWATPDGDGWRFERRCLSASGPAVDAHPPRAGDLGSTSRASGARRSRDKVYVKDGSDYWWPDGVYAGKSTQPYRLMLDDQADPKGMQCGPLRKGVVICIDDPAVEGSPAKRYAVAKLDPKGSPDVKHPKGSVKGMGAKCRTRIDIDKSGKVTEVDARACPEEFEKAVEEGVMGWTFPPHKVEGNPVLARTWTWVAFEG